MMDSQQAIPAAPDRRALRRAIRVPPGDPGPSTATTATCWPSTWAPAAPRWAWSRSPAPWPGPSTSRSRPGTADGGAATQDAERVVAPDLRPPPGAPSAPGWSRPSASWPSRAPASGRAPFRSTPPGSRSASASCGSTPGGRPHGPARGGRTGRGVLPDGPGPVDPPQRRRAVDLGCRSDRPHPVPRALASPTWPAPPAGTWSRSTTSPCGSPASPPPRRPPWPGPG